MSIVELSRVITAGLMLVASAANAQTTPPNAADPALVDRIKEAVIKELRESGALDRAVDAGVGRYVGQVFARSSYIALASALFRPGVSVGGVVP